MAPALASQAPDRSVDVDCSDADHQLQHSLESTYRSPGPNSVSYSSRKHGWNASHSSLESAFLSEVSGQFDDADEPDSPLPKHKGIAAAAAGNGSPSSHSVKRRRSNDWPQQTVDNDPTSRGEQQTTSSSSRQRWPFGHYYGRHASSTHGSPRSPRHARPGRRSRFVEGHMNDTVSEKPPSIFFRDEGRNNETARVANRQSGIFRFGKAIASAFNPFGGWGSVSEIWRGAQVQEGHPSQEDANDRLRQAEVAYEELKRSGYQGTAKGSYMQSLGAADTSLPEETWMAIQEKMDYNSGTVGGRHSRQSSGQVPSNRDSVSGNSLRPSFPDLRKAKSSISSIKKPDGMSSLLQHIDTRGQEVRHQKSRKDMQRQAKLMKRVSNLEDKLERARRELRELSGEEELLMRTSLNEEKPYQRKFVPGALPSLPSERLLLDPESTTPLNPVADGTLQVPNKPEEDQTEPQIRVNKMRLKPPNPWRKPSQPDESRSSSANSASRKRKSPDPESRKKPAPVDQEKQQQEQEGNPIPEPMETEPNPAQAPAEVPKTTPLRKPKLPKTTRGDSPGSVEQKQKQKRSPGVENSNATSPAEERTPSRPLRSTARNRSATPVLRMKRGRGDLRSTTSPGPGPSPSPGFDENKENNHAGRDKDDSNDDSSNKLENAQQQQDLEADHQNTATPTSARRKARYEYIPPVPPLPKDLAATAAKVDRRLAREMGKRRVQKERDGKGVEVFQWPEDIF